MEDRIRDLEEQISNIFSIVERVENDLEDLKDSIDFLESLEIDKHLSNLVDWKNDIDRGWKNPTNEIYNYP